MHPALLPWKMYTGSLLGCAVLFGGLRTLGYQGPSLARAALNVQADKEKGKYMGAEYCASCHESPRKSWTDDFVLLTEYRIWSTKDKHSQAYKVLTSERSKRMGELLGITDVTKAAACLNCHAANVPEELREEEFKLSDGVSCDVCHGPSSGWIVPHSLKRWRTTPMEKKERLGMIDVRDPVKRSRMCLSCHVGGEGKFVTHEMYAAGHPPLPGIEVATFSDEMPKHWRYVGEKDEAIRDLLKANPRELEKSKLTVVSGVVTFERSMDLLARNAKECIGAKSPDKASLNLSNYDCYACHHDLTSNSWRQKRGYTGKPGRPSVRPWPTALVRLAIWHAAGNDKEAEQESKQFDQDLRRLQNAFDERPYGNPVKIARRANGLAGWAKKLADRAMSKPCDVAGARELLARLLCLYKGRTVDYDSAREVAWAFDIIYSELKTMPDPVIEEVLKPLRGELRLELPSGKDRSILGELKQNLEAINNYDPEKFQRSLRALSDRLAQQGGR